MSTIKRMRNDEGVWVVRVTGLPSQPVIDFPATCDNCGQTSTKESPVCEDFPRMSACDGKLVSYGDEYGDVFEHPPESQCTEHPGYLGVVLDIPATPAAIAPAKPDAIRNAALEEAAVIAEGEVLTDNTGSPDDIAYDQAISDVALAIRAAKGIPA